MKRLIKNTRYVSGNDSECFEPATQSNGITKDYALFLIGEINKRIKGHYQRKTVYIEIDIFNNEHYYLISK